MDIQGCDELVVSIVQFQTGVSAHSIYDWTKPCFLIANFVDKVCGHGEGVGNQVKFIFLRHEKASAMF